MMGCAAARTGGAMGCKNCVCSLGMPGREPGRPGHRDDDGSGRSVVRAGELRHASVNLGTGRTRKGPAIGTPASQLEKGRRKGAGSR